MPEIIHWESVMEQEKIKSLQDNLSDRNKELHCLYAIDEVLNDFDSDSLIVFNKIIDLIPVGFRHSEICKAKLQINEEAFISENYKVTELTISSKIIIENREIGELSVVYVKPIKTINRIFSEEEVTLLNTIAFKISNYINHRNLRITINELKGKKSAKKNIEVETVNSNLILWLKSLNLTEKEIEQFTKIQIKFKKGETMCKQGSITSFIMLIGEGLSKNYLEGNQERGYNFSIVKPFDFIGLSSLYSSTTYYFSGAALTPCSVYIIENSVFKKAIANNAEFAQEILKWYCYTNERHLKRLSCIANKQALGRIAEILLYLKDNIFESNTINSYITRKDIAELAAMSTESAVRILSDLKKDKIISTNSNNDIEIIEEKLLRAISFAG
ncbi:MAG: Crp/Fnr family transcriptional regulator [Bacteroidetes bacterium]|nr:Crp/Fnr family transcriptional regulator [Bacteroidota bacterium]